MSLSDLLSDSLTPDTLAAIASRMGIDDVQTKKALRVALPALLQGLKKKSENPKEADSLHTALDEHGGDADDTVEMITHGRAKKGDKIISHILGDSTWDVVSAMIEKAWLDSTKAVALLEWLGPVVMNALGKVKQKQWLSASDLSAMLSGEIGIMRMVGGFFDQDGDRDFDIQDGLRVAMNILRK